MGYLGNPPTSAAFVTDTFNGTGSQTAYTMSVAPASTASMLVIVGAVLQDPSSYSIVGMTLNFSAAPPSGTGNISVRYMGIPASGVTNTAYRTVTDFTATAGQTTWTVPSYTVGFIDVFRNGARLGNTDFTATNGTSITLAMAANANDLITTVSFSVSSVLNAIPNTAGAVQAVNLAPGAARANFGAGAVLQVVSTTKPDTFSTTSTSYTNITGLSATITPTSTTSKILVMGHAAGAGTSGITQIYLQLTRNGTPIGGGTASGNRPSCIARSYYGDNGVAETMSWFYFDAPALASSLTYQMQCTTQGSGTVVIGTSVNSSNQFDGAITSSSITLMEIAA